MTARRPPPAKSGQPFPTAPQLGQSLLGGRLASGGSLNSEPDQVPYVTASVHERGGIGGNPQAWKPGLDTKSGESAGTCHEHANHGLIAETDAILSDVFLAHASRWCDMAEGPQ